MFKNKQRTVQNEKQFYNENDEDAREFEESIVKLVNFAKNRVKFEEFNAKDKYHLLELFVTNEATLMHIFQCLFPHKTEQ